MEDQPHGLLLSWCKGDQKVQLEWWGGSRGLQGWQGNKDETLDCSNKTIGYRSHAITNIGVILHQKVFPTGHRWETQTMLEETSPIHATVTQLNIALGITATRKIETFTPLALQASPSQTACPLSCVESQLLKEWFWVHTWLRKAQIRLKYQPLRSAVRKRLLVQTYFGPLWYVLCGITPDCVIPFLWDLLVKNFTG